jgi:hypothetical protein
VNRARREHDDAPQPVDIRVLRQIVHTQFVVPDVVSQPDGSRVITVVLPSGDALVFPLNADSSARIGQQLLAPSVQVASPADLPADQNGGRPA